MSVHYQLFSCGLWWLIGWWLVQLGITVYPLLSVALRLLTMAVPQVFKLEEIFASLYK